MSESACSAPFLRTLLRSIFAIGAATWLFTAVSSSAAPGSEHSRKFRTADPGILQAALRTGGEVIADYGSFKIVAVDESTAATLSANSGAEDVSDQNRIELNSGHLDTTRPEIKALRKTIAPGNSKALHLVQFAGPIKP